MNNEVNDNIETLDIETPVQEDKLNNTGLMDVIKQNKINSENGENQQPNFTVNPNAYHPSLNNNQNQVQVNPEPINNDSVETITPAPSEVEQPVEIPAKGLKGLPIDKSAIIVLLVTLLSHFLIVLYQPPHKPYRSHWKKRWKGEELR